jgi:hypothetical protein
MKRSCPNLGFELEGGQDMPLSGITGIQLYRSTVTQAHEILSDVGKEVCYIVVKVIKTFANCERNDEKVSLL